MSQLFYLEEAAGAEVEALAWVSPSSWRRKLRTRLSALILAAHPGKQAAQVSIEKCEPRGQL